MGRYTSGIFHPNLKLLLIVWVTTLLILGCTGQTMIQSTPVKKLDPEQALVTFFVKPSRPQYNFRWDIWDGHEFIGTLTDDTYIQYLAKPGQHMFMVNSSKWNFLKATVSKNKKYYVLLTHKRVNNQWVVSFYPITKGVNIDKDNIDKWISRLQPITVDESKRDEYLKTRFAQAKMALTDFNSHNIHYEELRDDDYRPVDEESYLIRLFNPQLPAVTTRDGDIASIDYSFKNSMELEHIRLAIKYEVRQDYVPSVTYLIKKGDKPNMGTKFNAPTFLMPPNMTGTIKFFIVNPEIQGPSSGRVGFADYKKGSTFWLHGKKNVTLFLVNCVDVNCSDRQIISNKIETYTNFEGF